MNLSIFAMIVVDTRLVDYAFKNAPGAGNKRKCLQKEFYSFLAAKLIDNSNDSLAKGMRQPRSSPNGTSYQEACIRAMRSGCAGATKCPHPFNSC
jgi:hypothetical protein